MNRVTHFEIHVDDFQRAIHFYKTVVGWECTQWEGTQPYWLITTGKEEPGINGGMVKRMGPINASGGDSVIAYVCTVDVENLDASLEKAQANGGTVALPKMEVPQVGWLAYCKDTEGNIFGMMQVTQPAA